MTPLSCFHVCSQQKSPEPDGSVAVNEEGKNTDACYCLLNIVSLFSVKALFVCFRVKQLSFRHLLTYVMCVRVYNTVKQLWVSVLSHFNHENMPLCAYCV